MTHRELWDKVDRMMTKALTAFMYPVRIRLGVEAFLVAMPPEDQVLDVEVMPDPQLLPLEVVLDADGRTGGFDEDLLTVLEKRGIEVSRRLESSEDWSAIPLRVRGNRPKFKGFS